MEHWEVHVHHADNVKAINEKRKQIEIWRKLSMQSPISKPVMSRLSDFIYRRSEKKTGTPQATSGFAMTKMFQPTNVVPSGTLSSQAVPQSSQALTQPKLIIPQSSQAYTQANQASAQGSLTIPQPNQALPAPSQMQTFQQVYTPHQSNHGNHTPVKHVNNWFTRNELRRRPLRNYEQKDGPQASYTRNTTTLRNKFMSAFGMSSFDMNKPAGLRNEGQNLCFMNCVIQCLSHTPSLVDKLVYCSDGDIDCSEAESVMLVALTNLMSQCKKTSREGQNDGVLDPTILREAMSVLHNGLVSPPMERQHQQDAAEFFMWLIEALHTALNKKTDKGNSFYIH